MIITKTYYISGEIMKIKKQDKENKTEDSRPPKGTAAQKSKTVGKPSKTAKPLARKTIAEEAGISKKPIVTKTPESAANPAIFGELKAERPGIEKEHIKNRTICKATFVLPGEAAPKARTVTIVGDFNNWNRDATPLKKLGNGDFAVTVELDAGKEYRFRYLIDGHRWENDWHADRYVKSPYGSEDSVVRT
jgi:hypothetical protein